MKPSLIFAIILTLTSCSSPKTGAEETNPNPISNIQHSTKYVRGLEAFPFVLGYNHIDTISISEILQVTAYINSNMFKEIASYENLELSYLISASHKEDWKGEIKVEPSDTMKFELKFDSLEIQPNTTHIWQFISVASFTKEDKFFYDTTAVYNIKIFLTNN